MTFLLKNWRIGLLAVGIALVWATVVSMRGEIDRLRAEVEVAEIREDQALDAAAQERANATELAERLELARQEARREREARAAAEKARDAALAASEERGEALRETIVIERGRDATLDQCLALDLPDSLVRQLPFGAGGAGPDRR